MQGDEVCITGIGLLTPLGLTTQATLQAWQEGRRVSPEPLAELRGTPLEGAPVAVLPAFDAAERVGGRRLLKYMSEAAVLAVAAGREAIAEARLRECFAGEEIGLFAATGMTSARPADFAEMIQASLDTSGRFCYRRFAEQGLPSTNPLISFRILANMPPCLLSISEGLKGPSYIFSPWEGQGAAALVEAWRAVQSREVRAAVVGAADTPASVSHFVYLRQAGLLGATEFPASVGAYLVFEGRREAERDGQRVYATLAEMEFGAHSGPVHDPLAQRMGRCFAAAPAALLALSAALVHASRIPQLEQFVAGVDGQGLRFVLTG